MNLLIYQACQDESCKSQELGIRVEWSQEVPEVGDITNMASSPKWRVVEVVPYHSKASVIQGAFLVYVHPVDSELSPKEDWDSALYMNSAIHVEMSEVGQPELQVGWNVLGQAPTIGERLMNYEATEHPTWMQPVATDWVIDSFDEFLPQTQSFYKAIYIAWCKAERFAIAA